MALPVTIPYTFGTATTSIPLSQLDTDFSTVVTALNGVSDGTSPLANVSIIGGNISGLANPITVSSGGTGLNFLTANSLLIGNGNSAVQFLAPGTTGNIVYSNGTAWISQSASALNSGRLLRAPQILTTAGSGTYTTPAGCNSIYVEAVGGGGGGGAGPTGSGGGGAGGVAKYFTVTPSTGYSYVLGAGGAAATAGGNTTFTVSGVTINANGGGAGANGAGGAGASGGTATNGDLNISGQSTITNSLTGTSGVNAVGGNGGNPGLANYGNGGFGAWSGNGKAASGYGGGGGGGGTSFGTGGAGTQGVIRIWEYA